MGNRKNFTITNKCKVCKHEFEATGYNPKLQFYCSKKCKNIVYTKKHQKYVLKNPKIMNDINNKHHGKLKKAWGYKSNNGKEIERGLKAEKWIEPKLKKIGFINILHNEKFSRMFTGDFIATKNGRNCIIEVTTAFTHSINTHKILCKRLNLDLYIIFIKPNFSFYKVKKVDINSFRKSMRLNTKEVMNTA